MYTTYKPAPNFKPLPWLLLTGILLLPQASIAAEHSGHMEEAKHDHGDNPVLVYGAIDHLETALDEEEEAYALDAQGWIGKDLDKLWLKTDLEVVEGEVEESELQLLYGRAIAAYWDLQLGLRHDNKPSPSQDWLVLGVQGLAPYWFDVDAALFIASGGQTSVRLQAEYELLITQRLVLSPHFGLTFYGQNDPVQEVGAGLAEAEASLRLSYAIRREFSPYLGITWRGHYGNTADYARQADEAVRETQAVIGVQAWF